MFFPAVSAWTERSGGLSWWGFRRGRRRGGGWWCHSAITKAASNRNLTQAGALSSTLSHTVQYCMDKRKKQKHCNGEGRRTSQQPVQVSALKWCSSSDNRSGFSCEIVFSQHCLHHYCCINNRRRTSLFIRVHQLQEGTHNLTSLFIPLFFALSLCSVDFLHFVLFRMSFFLLGF